MAVVNWTTGDQRQLSQGGFYVAKCCNGQTDFDSLAFLPHHHALLDKLIQAGIAEACGETASIETWQRYRKADNPHLTGIHWCVTGFCNLHCRHCYMEAPTGRYGGLPFKDLARFVDQFERANVIEVLLTGGEPFVRRDLMDILQLLAAKRIRVGEIYSNGLLITEKHLERIREIGFSPVFQISFDGIGHHDRMRGTDGIEQSVIDAIRRLRAATFEVVVATSIDKLNIGCLAETYKLIKQLDVQTWTIAPPLLLGNWRATTTGTLLDDEAAAYAPLLTAWLEDGKPINIHLAPFFRGYRSGAMPYSDSPESEVAVAEAEVGQNLTPESYDCYVCREQPNLLPDGSIVPCPGYVDGPLHDRMPNLLHDDLSAVWTRSLLRQIADLRKQDLLAVNPECISCSSFKECGLGCRASALRETGDLMAKDPVLCELWTTGIKKRFQEMAVRKDR